MYRLTRPDQPNRRRLRGGLRERITMGQPGSIAKYGELCMAAARLRFPELPEEAHSGFLMEYTAFPYGDLPYIVGQLEELRVRGNSYVQHEVYGEPYLLSAPGEVSE